MGNTTVILPRGVVCDLCNNYFSREVEKPFLDFEPIKALRFEQALPSKKGKIPPQTGIITPISAPAIITRHKSGPFIASAAVPSDFFKELRRIKEGKLIFPAPSNPPTGAVVSRFLAKVALELVASRLVNHPELVDRFVDEKQLDLIRHHAKRGETPVWPYHYRIIYDRNTKWTDISGSPIQVVHEEDILMTEWGEWFLVIAIFGMEFAINYGGPEIDGYRRWLAENDNAGPFGSLQLNGLLAYSEFRNHLPI